MTVFIVLTGENWNEIMVQVINQQNSFTPAIFFIIVLIVGNFMLLNLFLAILLKSISSPKPDEDTEEDSTAKRKQEEDKKDESKDQEHEGSHILNASNSNIEDEFTAIKNQLMKLSKGLQIKLDNDESNKQSVDIAQNSDDMSVSISAESERKRTGSKKNPKQKKDNVSETFNNEQSSDKKPEVVGRSLFIFAEDNLLRRGLKGLISSSYFAGFIYHMIAFNSLLLILEAPDLKDNF